MSTVTPSPLRELMKEQNYNLDAFFTSLPTVVYRLLVGNLRCTLTSSKRWSAWLVHSLLSCALLHSQSLIFLLCPSCFSSCPHLFQCSSNYSPELHSGTQHSPVLCSPVAWVCCELKGKTVPCGSSRSLSFAWESVCVILNYVLSLCDHLFSFCQLGGSFEIFRMGRASSSPRRLWKQIAYH